MSFQTSALVLSWAAILLLALVVSGLIRQVHQLAAGPVRTGPIGLPVGAQAPGLDQLAPGETGDVLLLFLSADCGTCTEMLTEASTIDSPNVTVRALYAGAVPGSAAGSPVAVHGGQHALFATYDAIATPFAVLIDAAGRITRSEPLGSRGALHTLLTPTGSLR
jgi:hypothetical protein